MSNDKTGMFSKSKLFINLHILKTKDSTAQPLSLCLVATLIHFYVID